MLMQLKLQAYFHSDLDCSQDSGVAYPKCYKTVDQAFHFSAINDADWILVQQLNSACRTD